MRGPVDRRFSLPLLLLLIGLAGCEQLGIPTPASQAAKKEADAKAIGGACRHAGRAIEDCYTLNRKADKAAVFAGWREMNDYMRENSIESVAPVLPPPSAAAAASAQAAASGAATGKPAEGDGAAHAGGQDPGQATSAEGQGKADRPAEDTAEPRPKGKPPAR